MNKKEESSSKIDTLEKLAELSDYSLLNNLTANPESKKDGIDYEPRQVYSGHYVNVKPTPIPEAKYITHSKTFFKELGLCDTLATSSDFMKMFSGDLSNIPSNLSKNGWATGYALSIFGTEYYQQCPFGTGNAYGDGRAISIFEALINTKRWEMQLKGAGKTPYCRGADGRAVLRSSIREFLAQEHMYSLGVSTSRSLSLYTSSKERVNRPWFSKGLYSKDPDMMISEDIAISTRVAPSFLRVGQIELFARRARKNEHENALKELEDIVVHLIQREYNEQIQEDLPLEEKIVLLALEFRNRLTSLIANWIRVGYCQGNFNSDNCAAGGFTLDYGPFGFCDLFDPNYQSWTGGGEHFAFFNQTIAANRNFDVFCESLMHLLNGKEKYTNLLNDIKNSFSQMMEEEMNKMWSLKLGLKNFDEELFHELLSLMIRTSVDYTIFFRELANIPKDVKDLEKSFYDNSSKDQNLQDEWNTWLDKWKSKIDTNKSIKELSNKMKKVNPKYTLREWFLVPAYEQAKKGDYNLIYELQDIMTSPYEENTKEVEEKYYKLKPYEFFDLAGVSHVSCSS